MTSIYLPDYGLYLDETLQVNRDANLIICILKNVTEEKTRHRRAMQKRQQTAAIADEIVEKQLRMVHEIAPCSARPPLKQRSPSASQGICDDGG